MNIKPNNPRITCADGVSLSVQASEFHYCSPRLNEIDHWADYSAVEVGYIEDTDGNAFTPPDEWSEYADGAFPASVYGYVPTEMVKAFIEEHGGAESTITNN